MQSPWLRHPTHAYLDEQISGNRASPYKHCMKKLIFFISFLVLTLSGNGQSNKLYHDSLLTIMIKKQIGFPYDDGPDSSGVTLIKIYKQQDSLKMDIVYASAARFALANDGGLKKRINKYKERFPDGYKTYIPIYFVYDNGNSIVPTAATATKTLSQKIKRLGKKVHVLDPISIPGYAPVH